MATFTSPRHRLAHHLMLRQEELSLSLPARDISSASRALSTTPAEDCARPVPPLFRALSWQCFLPLLPLPCPFAPALVLLRFHSRVLSLPTLRAFALHRPHRQSRRSELLLYTAHTDNPNAPRFCFTPLPTTPSRTPFTDIEAAL